MSKPQPGVRRLEGRPVDRVVVEFDEPLSNFIPSHDPKYNNRPCNIPVMSASGSGIEGFGHRGMFWRLIIFIIIIGFIYYLIQQNKQ